MVTDSLVWVWWFRWEKWGGGELGDGVVKADGVSFDLFLLWYFKLLNLTKSTLGGCEGQMSTPRDIRVCLTHQSVPSAAHSKCSIDLC